MPAVTFYFDFVSPYAYLANATIDGFLGAEVRVERRPVLFAAMLNHYGQLGPAEIGAKRRYVFADVVRRAGQHGVPIAPPPTHPFNPLTALRASLCVEANERRALIDRLFAHTWASGAERGIEHPEVVREIAEDIGLDGAAILERASSMDIKAALRDNTGEAIARGAFGVPTLFVEGGVVEGGVVEGGVAENGAAEDGVVERADTGDAMFWGFESFDLLALHLAGDDPARSLDPGAFDAVRASADRRG